MDDERFMQLAIAKAREGIAHGQSPFAACLVRAGQVVACCHNHVYAATDPTAHAEVVTLRAASQALRTIDLVGCTIYSTTEPCPMCFAAIHWAHVDRIVYGASIADAAAAGFRELAISNAQVKQLGGAALALKPGVLSAEARELFALFRAAGGRCY